MFSRLLIALVLVNNVNAGNTLGSGTHEENQFQPSKPGNLRGLLVQDTSAEDGIRSSGNLVKNADVNTNPDVLCPISTKPIVCPTVYLPVICGYSHNGGCLYGNSCLAWAAGFEPIIDCVEYIPPTCPTSDPNTICPAVYMPVICGKNGHNEECLYDNSCLAESAGFVASDCTTL